MTAKKQFLTEDRQEYIRPVTAQLPVSFYITDFGEADYDCVNWHWHEAFQYAMVTGGRVVFQTPDRRVVLEEGEGVFINYRQPHFIGRADAEKASYVCLDISPEAIDCTANGFMYKRYIAPLLGCDSVQMLVFKGCTECDKDILDGIRQIRGIVARAEANPELKILSVLFRIWDHTITRLSIVYDFASAVDCAANFRLREILGFIRRNYARKIALDDVARHVGLSRSECCRFFHKMTGQTLFDYIAGYRVSQSLPLLKEDRLSIAEVAVEAGFSSQSYYGKTFKKYKGCSPKEYRQMAAQLAQ